MSKMDRHREKLIQDRLQVLLQKMLQEEDNKYCVDCDSKGPRWVSWNLGIFLCIRCAGIHRNLGVHISKVKSVNLDSWTPQQVASMQVMGNSKARAVYEAGMPEDHRRPVSSDSSLEQFIRNKYEKKKWVAREWRPTPPPDLPIGWAEIIEAEKQKKDIRTVKLPSINAPQQQTPEHTASNNSNNKPSDSNTSVPAKQTPAAKLPTQQPEKAKQSSSFDLLGLSTNPTPTPQAAAAPASSTAKVTSDFDLLCLGSSGPNPTPAAAATSKPAENDNDFNDFVGVSSTAAAAPAASSTSDMFADFANASGGGAGPQAGSQMSKDSIMALFNKPPQQAAAPAVSGGAGFGMMGQTGGMPPNVNNPLSINQQLNQLGLQVGRLSRPASSMAPANNPFLANSSDMSNFGALNGLGGPANSIAPAQANKQSWGFH